MLWFLSSVGWCVAIFFKQKNPQNRCELPNRVLIVAIAAHLGEVQARRW